jgi:tetratricopeptide (TPR) repeat protein
MGNYQAALADFDQVLELKPNDTWAILQQGKTRLLMGNYQAALANFDQALKLEPDNALLHYHRGLLRLAMSTPDQAKDNLSEAIRLASQTYKKSPQEWHNAFNLALYHLAAEQTKEAKRLYRKTSAGSAPGHAIRAAIQDLDEFLCLFPAHAQAQAMHQLLQERLDS